MLMHRFIFCLFDNSHPNVCEVVSHFGFDFSCLIPNDAEYLFMFFLTICISSLGKLKICCDFHLLFCSYLSYALVLNFYFLALFYSLLYVPLNYF